LTGQAYNTSMNKLSTAERTQIVAALVEGNSIRATCRMTGFAKNTVTKLLVDLGRACRKFHDATVTGISCKRIQCDEIWSFVGAKSKNASAEAKAMKTAGDVWTWTALDAQTKLIVTWLVGSRGGSDAFEFMQDVASRLTSRVQLTSDGHRVYLDAVRDAFDKGCVDYAMLVKLYGETAESEKRYSPAQCIGTRKTIFAGDPDPAHISASFVERQNLTMCMSMRRFTRLTNAFSKKVENHEAAIALHFVHYNFVRIHQTLRVTPAMQAGIAAKPWEISDIVALLA
jgi:IS1 family transposase